MLSLKTRNYLKMEKAELNVDSILETLLDAQYFIPGTKVNIPEDQIVLLVDKVTEIFMNQPVLLDLKAPIKICGILNFCFKLIK